VNAETVRRCVQLLADSGYDGVLSIECEAQGGPLLERSLEWVRALLASIQPSASATCGVEGVS
jgi:inosose dehydratase